MRPRVAQMLFIIVSAAICLAFDASNEVIEATSDEAQEIAASTRLENTVAANDTYDRNRKKWGNFDHKKHTTEYKVPCRQCHGSRRAGNIRTPFLGPKKCNQCHKGTPTFR
jgi:hypothetical protein